MMFLEDFKENYILSDGQVVSLVLDFEHRQAQVRIRIRKWQDKKPEPCLITLVFNQVTEIDLMDSFNVSSYSDVVFLKIAPGLFYVSFDPFDNSGTPSEKDNFVIKSKECVFFDGAAGVPLT